jgi:alkylhydroperoxidase/carboxymuconolactone decarboxylase family protein YurZ
MMSAAPLPTSPPPPAHPVILTDDDLELLRRQYVRDVLLGLAPRMVHHAKAKGFVDWISQVVFSSSSQSGGNSLTPAQREMVILSVLATQRDTFVMAGHIYWALMEGLSVEQVADTLMTVATYTGINDLRYSCEVFDRVLALLKDRITSRDDLSTGALAQALAREFGTPPRTPTPPPPSGS